MAEFLQGFQGLGADGNLGTAYFFFLLTFGLNLVVVAGGIRRGIEFVSKVFLPMLFGLALLLVLQIFWLGAEGMPDPDWRIEIFNGLGYLWNPDVSVLGSSRVWLAAAGQVLFTLSVGIGAIVTYASYLKRDDDVALSSLTAVGTNELAEVILGGCLVIPAAYAFFGAAQMADVAKSGAFNLGFVTMPLVLNSMPWPQLFGCAWFLLLFLAGVTSSISLAQPVIAFFQNVFGWKRAKAVAVFGLTSFVLCQPAIWWLGRGAVDEMDFWGGTFCLVLFGLLEVLLFGWVFGMDKAWREIHHGAQLKLPALFRPVIQYVTPAYLIFVLGFWLYDNAKTTISMQGVDPANRPYVLATRALLVLLLTGLALSMRRVLHRRRHIRELEV